MLQSSPLNDSDGLVLLTAVVNVGAVFPGELVVEGQVPAQRFCDQAAERSGFIVYRRMI